MYVVIGFNSENEVVFTAVSSTLVGAKRAAERRKKKFDNHSWMTDWQDQQKDSGFVFYSERLESFYIDGVQQTLCYEIHIAIRYEAAVIDET